MKPLHLAIPVEPLQIEDALGLEAAARPASRLSPFVAREPKEAPSMGERSCELAQILRALLGRGGDEHGAEHVLSKRPLEVATAGETDVSAHTTQDGLIATAYRSTHDLEMKAQGLAARAARQGEGPVAHESRLALRSELACGRPQLALGPGPRVEAWVCAGSAFDGDQQLGSDQVMFDSP